MRYVDEIMGKTMIDYELKSLSETNIFDVFEYCAPSKPEEPADSKKAPKDSGKKAEK